MARYSRINRNQRVRLHLISDKDSEKKGGLAQHLASISALRDALLVAAPLLYVIGYLVWSFYAWQNHLGLLPALDPQYFVAGLVPVAIVVAAYIGGKYFKRFLIDKWPELVSKQAKGFWRVVRIILLIIFWVTILLMMGLIIFGPALSLFWLLIYLTYTSLKRFAPKKWAGLSEKAKGWPPAVHFTLVLLVLGVSILLWLKQQYFSEMIRLKHSETLETFLLFGVLISITLLPPMKTDYFSWLSIIYRWMWLYFGVLMFVVLGLLFYLESVYPKIPQEFGGVQPRCAYLDVVKSQVSNETLAGIAPSDALNSKQSVVRSSQLKILYSGNNLILIRSQEGKVYEIAKGVVQATAAAACESPQPLKRP